MSSGNSWKKTYSFLIRFILKTGSIIVGIILLFTFVFGINRMKGNIMFPSLRDGDLCVYYRLETPTINDVVLYEDSNGVKRAGRIVAVGGQEINFSDEGGFTVDGYTPSEEVPYETYKAEDSKVEYPLTLSLGSYFIMNDFRSITDDSRSFGEVDKSQVIGKLLFVLRRRNF